jgi:hypothetical protein
MYQRDLKLRLLERELREFTRPVGNERNRRMAAKEMAAGPARFLCQDGKLLPRWRRAESIST